MNAAVFYGPNSISVKSVPVANGSAILRVKTCAVCGYDARVFRNGHSKVTPPIILGHELCGEVVETVKSGRTEIKAGSRVAVCPVVPCLTCHYCQSCDYNLCGNLKEIGSTVNGGFAEFIGIPENVLKIGGLVPVPDELSDEEAALLEPLACCLNSTSRMGIHEKGRSVVIIGDGTMGLIHLQLLKLEGAKVVVVGKVGSRMQKARDLKADMVAEFEDPETTAQKVLDFTSSVGASTVIVATSNSAAIELATRICAKNATINLFAGMPKDYRHVLDTNWIHYNQITVTGAFGCTPQNLREAANMAGAKQVDLPKLITHRYPISEIEQAVIATEKYYGLRSVIDRF
jgi:L-iditol 2-dehydrogenase